MLGYIIRGLVLAEATLGCTLTVGVVVLYAHNFRKDQRSRYRFLPWHIGFIASSFVLFATYGTVDMLDRLGDPLTWRAPYLSIAAGTGVVAQSFMFTAQWRIHRFLRGGA